MKLLHVVVISIYIPLAQASITHSTLLFNAVLHLFHAAYGRNIPAVSEQPLQHDSIDIGRNTVTYQARLLKALFLQLTEY